MMAGSAPHQQTQIVLRQNGAGSRRAVSHSLREARRTMVRKSSSASSPRRRCSSGSYSSGRGCRFGSTIADRRGRSSSSAICETCADRRFFIGAGVTIAEATAGCVRFRLRPRERQDFGSTLGMAMRPRCVSACNLNPPERGIGVQD